MTDNYLSYGELQDVALVCKELTTISKTIFDNDFISIGAFGTEGLWVHDANGDLLGTISLGESGGFVFYPKFES